MAGSGGLHDPHLLVRPRLNWGMPRATGNLPVPFPSDRWTQTERLIAVSSTHGAVTEFIHGTTVNDVPAHVLHQGRRCLLDLIGVAAAGARTPLSQILRNHADGQSGSPSKKARLLFDGRRVAAADAAMANAGTIDAMDGHDGHRLVKGHAGAAVLPAALAFLDGQPGRTVQDLLVSLIVAYEVSLRAGIALHQNAADYHSSGAWNALGAAAVGARLLGFGRNATREALGIAEYTAPRGPMMRAIKHPTMVKDSSAWGARAGVEAALLAAQGFTGAPAELLEDGPDTDDLGHRWRIGEQYFKPYPVCRWAHPAIQAGLALAAVHRIPADQIENVEVTTFEAATRLHTQNPLTTEEAQYSLPFALASALVHGELTPENVLNPQRETDALRLAGRIRLAVSVPMTEKFPAARRAEVRIVLRDGRSWSSGPTEAVGDLEAPLSDAVLIQKFEENSRSLGTRRRSAITATVMSEENQPLEDLMSLVMAPALTSAEVDIGP